MCENLTFTHICPSCQKLFLTPSFYKRQLSNGVEVFSFYKYQDIKNLLHTKHTDLGYYIYTILAKKSFQIFAESFSFPNCVLSIPIDDHVENGYSHTAILNKSLSSTFIKPQYNILRAQNKISYSGKSKEFRSSNPRNFQLKKISKSEVILVDDIITTGATLTQAIDILQEKNVEVLFCITLADANLK